MREGWEYKKLGDCFPYIKNGANIKQIKGADGLPITRIETLSGGVFNRDRMGYAGIYNLDKYSDYVLEDGDLLLSHINSKTYIGRTVEYRAKNDETIIHGMNLLRLKSNLDVINSSFFAYYTLSNDFKTNVAKVRKDAVNQSSIAISDIRKFSIPVPPIQSQQYVVDELDKINELIRLKKEQLKDYDNLAQSIFYEMFGDPVVNEKGWEVKKLGDVCKFTQGTQVPIEEQHLSKENGLVQFLRIIDFTQGKDAPRFVKCSNDKYILHEREIAVVRYGTPGFICYGKIGAIANNLFKITPNQKDMFEFEFLVHWLNTEAFQSAVKSKQYGAALQAIKFSTIQGINIIIPLLTVQRSFATRISQIDKQKQYIEESIKELESLLASRMQYWFD